MISPPITLEELQNMVAGQYEWTLRRMQEPPTEFHIPEDIFTAFPDVDELSLLERKGLAVKLLFSHAPLPEPQSHDLIGGNIFHYGDQYNQGYPAYWLERDGISSGWHHLGHCAPDYATFLQEGLVGIRKKTESAMRHFSKSNDQNSIQFLKGQIHAMEGMETWSKRLVEVYSQEGESYADVVTRLRHTTKGKPSNFPQTLQNAWFLHAVLQNNATPCAIGRVDQFLWPYLQLDLDKGVVSIEEAQCWVDAYILKFSERTHVGKGNRSLGDTGFQNMVVGGTGIDGEDQSNPLTALILKSLERFKIIEPKITIRLSPNNSKRDIIGQVCRVLRTGAGQPAIYNDATLVPALLAHGWSEEDAYDYCTDGCWETTIPGKSTFFWLPLDLLSLLLRALRSASNREVNDFTGFLDTYLAVLDKEIATTIKAIDSTCFLKTIRGPLFSKDAREMYDLVKKEILEKGLPDEDRLSLNGFHHLPDGDLLFSAFLRGTRESGRDMMSLGTERTIFAIVARAVANTADSLMTIKKAVYEEKEMTLANLCEILSSDYDGRETLRQRFIHWYPKYGNDDDEVDSIASKIANFVIDSVEKHQVTCPFPNVHLTVGVATYGWDVEMGKKLGASPDGRHLGDPIANNMSPSAGMALNGPSAIIGSFSKMPGNSFSAGAPIDLFLEQASVDGQKGLDRFVGFIETFLEEGGNLLSVNIVSVDDLRRAKENPEKYQDLRVRMGGWQAYFVSLSEEAQDLLIRKAKNCTGRTI